MCVGPEIQGKGQEPVSCDRPLLDDNYVDEQRLVLERLTDGDLQSVNHLMLMLRGNL